MCKIAIGFDKSCLFLVAGGLLEILPQAVFGEVFPDERRSRAFLDKVYSNGVHFRTVSCDVVPNDVRNAFRRQSIEGAGFPACESLVKYGALRGSPRSRG